MIQFKYYIDQELGGALVPIVDNKEWTPMDCESIEEAVNLVNHILRECPLKS